MIKVTLQFHSQHPNGWGFTKKFNDQAHLDNYLAYMEREKGHVIDEVWIWKDENNWR